MAATGKLTANELIDKKAIERTRELKTEMKELLNIYSKVKGAKDLNVAMEKSVKTTEKLSNEQKELNAAMKSLERQRQKGLSQMAKQEHQERELVRAANMQVKSIDDLKRQTNALVKIRNRLDMTNKSNVKEYQKLTNQINKNTNALKKGDKQIGRFQRNVGDYKQALNSIKLGFIAIAMAVRAAINASKKYIEAWKVQKTAETKLITIMRQRSKATNEQIKEVIALTSAQQKLGIIGDEVQLSGAQQLATFTNQTESLKTLIPAMNNLVAQQKGYDATASDATNVANLMGKALQGQVGALTKVGISFSEAQAQVLKYGDEEERAAMLAQVITDNVGNMNEELAKTPTGKITAVKNALGDTQETLGRIIEHIAAHGIIGNADEQVRNIEAIQKKLIHVTNQIIVFQNKTRIVGAIFSVLFESIRTQFIYMGEMIKTTFIRPIELAIESFLAFKNFDFKTALSVIKTAFIREGKEIVNTAKNVGMNWAEVFKKNITEYEPIPLISDEIEEVILKDLDDSGKDLGNAIGRNIVGGILEEVQRRSITDALQPNNLKGSLATPSQPIEEEGIDYESILFGEGGLSGAKDNFDEALSLWENYYNQRAQLIAQDIQASQSRISQLEKEVEEERKLAEQGKNNKLETKKEELSKEMELRNKKLEEQKQVQKQQEQIDSLQQISALVTAVANIFAAESKEGVIGVLLAIAGVAAMLGSYVITKGQIKGGEYAEGGWVEGNSHADNGVNIEAEGGEFIVRKDFAPQAAELLEQINSGRIDDSLLGKNILDDPKIALANYPVIRDIDLQMKGVEREVSNMINEQRRTNQLLDDRLLNVISQGNDIVIVKGKYNKQRIRGKA